MVSLTFGGKPARLPDNETLKVALLAQATASPALEKTLLGTQPAPGPARMVAPETQGARKVRAQAIAFELFANNGRYCSRSDGVALTKQKDLGSHPLTWAVIPAEGDDATLFGPANDPEAQRLREQLFRTLTIPGRSEPLKIVLLPLQWEEAKTLKTRFPDLTLLEDGQVYRGSSPRSLFIGAQEGQQPSLVSGIEGYSLKMHLSKATYERLGGLGGNRDINFNDALFATVLTQTLKEATKDIPLIEIQSEARAVAARVRGENESIEVGAIFRKFDDTEPAVPGFAFFSKTRERLPWVGGSDLVDVRAQKDERYLVADAIAYAQKKNPGLTKKGALLKLFVDPLLDVNFGLFSRGWSMELHPQNFLLKMDEKTGLTKRVVIRDLHGLGYSAAYRQEHGLPDQFALDQLRKEFPDLEQTDIDGYFFRDGALRDRYKPPAMFASSIDFFTSIFWFHLLDAAQRSGMFSKDEISDLVENIKDHVHQKAKEHGFDLSTLPQPKGKQHDYWDADKNGIRGRILFRRAA